jgi:hypothetical protein
MFDLKIQGGDMLKKAFFLLGVLIICLSAVLADVKKKQLPIGPGGTPDVSAKPEIVIIEPASSSQPHLTSGVYEKIKWNFSPYFVFHPQNCQLYWGSYRISPDVAVTHGEFIWDGQRHDGTMLPVGDHKITIKCPAYETPDGPRYVIAEDPDIRIAAPPNGAVLKMGEKYKITWTYSNWFDYIKDDMSIICPPYEVSWGNVKDGEFLWTVGMKRDGNFMPAGEYHISIDHVDAKSSHDPEITISSLSIPSPYHILDKYWINRFPECPMCFRFNVAQIKINEPVIIEIARGAKVLARWNAGERKASLRQVKIIFDKESFGLLDKETAAFELRILSPQGKILKSKLIRLETR